MALTALPIHLALSGVPSTLEILFYAWLATPILIACYLSRTGHYEARALMSSVALAALIAAIGMATGGITSFAAVWLVVVPLEAALSASRRVVIAASALALMVAGLLYAAAAAHASLAATLPRDLMALGIISAALYATGLALGSASLARTSSRLLVVEEDRYRLLARNITDVITRHRRNGTVRFASPAAESPVRRAGEDAARVTACSTACMSPTARPISRRSPMPRRKASAARSNSASGAKCRGEAEAPGPVHLGRDALPRARSRRRTIPMSEQRSRRGHPRRDRAQDAGAGGRGRARGSRTRQRGEEPVPRHDEPRAAHAAQRDHRLLRDARQRRDDAARQGAPARIRHADRRVRSSSAVGGQRHPRHVEDRVRQLRDHAGAVRARAGGRNLLRPDGVARARSPASISSAASRPICRTSSPTSAP